MIEFKDAGFAYDVKSGFVLRHFSEEIHNGEFVALTGRSGIGKTTLIRLLLRELELSEGSILVEDEDIGKIPPAKVPFYRRRMGVIFQDFKLIRDMQVYDNLNLSRRIYGWGQKESDTRIMHVLKFLGIDHFHKRYPDELSGGEQQKVCLARAILNDPKILLADEPTKNLDPRSSRELVRLLELIHRQGTTVIMATHDMDSIISEEVAYRELKLPDM